GASSAASARQTPERLRGDERRYAARCKRPTRGFSLQFDVKELAVRRNLILQRGLLRVAVFGNNGLQFLGRLGRDLVQLFVHTNVVLEGDGVIAPENARLRAAVAEREVAVVISQAAAGPFADFLGEKGHVGARDRLSLVGQPS